MWVFHGICEKNFSCANCKGNHRVNYKGCPKFLDNKRINTMMANENISPFKANNKSMREEKETKYNYDLQKEQWPTLQKSFKKKVNSGEDRKKRLFSLQVRERHQEGEKKEMEAEPREFIRTKDESVTPRSGRRDELTKRDTRPDYYKQFNNRDMEIRKENWGIGLKRYNKDDKSVSSNIEIGKCRWENGRLEFMLKEINNMLRSVKSGYLNPVVKNTKDERELKEVRILLKSHMESIEEILRSQGN